MALQITFIVSGFMVALLLVAKVWEEKNRRSFFLLRVISKGDERIRTYSINAAHEYSDFKEKAKFFFEKQLPLHTRNFVNKSTAYIGEKFAEYTGSVRGNKFLRKNEGISEFFKNISDKEKGEINEEMHDPQDADSQNREDQVK